jgi:nicotinic acid mononucleotide adenylyltransferase
MQSLAQLLQKPAAKTSLMLTTQFNARSQRSVLNILNKIDALNTIEASSLDQKRGDISSTFIRQSFKMGQDPSLYIKESVHQYIRAKGLYNNK